MSNELSIGIDNRSYHPGDTVHGELTVTLDKEIKMKTISLRTKGVEKVTAIPGDRQSGGPPFVKERAVIFDNTIILAEAGELTVGVHRYPFSFQVPRHIPPSHEAERVSIRYWIKARVDIPWAVDLRNKWSFTVKQNPKVMMESMGPLPIDSYISEKAPSIDAQLNTDKYLVNDIICGYLAVRNPTEKKIRKAIITLLYYQYREAHGWGESTEKIWKRLKIPGEELLDGARREFEIQIPADLPASYKGKLSSLSHHITIDLDVAWAFDADTFDEFYVYR